MYNLLGLDVVALSQWQRFYPCTGVCLCACVHVRVRVFMCVSVWVFLCVLCACTFVYACANWRLCVRGFLFVRPSGNVCT